MLSDFLTKRSSSGKIEKSLYDSEIKKILRKGLFFPKFIRPLNPRKTMTEPLDKKTKTDKIISKRPQETLYNDDEGSFFLLFSF